MFFSQFNMMSIIAAAVANMVIGMLWYSPMLFGSVWAKGRGKDINKASAHMGHFVGAFFIALTVAFGLAHFISVLGIATFADAVKLSLTLSVAFISTALFSNVIWAGTAIEVFLIETGNWIATLIAMSYILLKM